jgi:lysozyme
MSILGIDVSKWQGLWDWDISVEQGIRFAFIRAGSINNVTGVCYEDYLFPENAEAAPSRMPVGFYWYFRPQHNPTKQANYFCDLIEEKDWKLPPVLDIETDGGLGNSVVGSACAEFVGRVYERTETWPIIYTRGYFWNDNVAYRSIFDECDLWVARYTWKAKPWGNLFESPKLAPNYWKTWTFWQYSDENNKAVQYGGPGPPSGDDDVDLNWFNGDQAAFDDYYKTEPSTSLPDVLGVKINVEYEGVDVKYQGKVTRV